MDQYRKDFEALRRRTNESLSKLQKVETGTGSPAEQAQIHGEVKEVEAQLTEIESVYKQLIEKLDQNEARVEDEELRYLRQRVQILRENYAEYCEQGRGEIQVNESDYNGGAEQAQELKLMKDQQLDSLNEKAKVLKQQNQLINEKLVEGSEIIEQLGSDVTLAKDEVKASTTKVEEFGKYLKKNKAPFWSAIILIVFSVFLWSTKAFCSIGLTWQCP